jgi:hypothetical protein
VEFRAANLCLNVGISYREAQARSLLGSYRPSGSFFHPQGLATIPSADGDKGCERNGLLQRHEPNTRGRVRSLRHGPLPDCAKSGEKLYQWWKATPREWQPSARKGRV